eukprot:CAMPEP_0183305624 /NCGR_PEP_ID=MMETSP0160_2-20130417/10303_1 /TAXON_ID=2839 ORGANISM="Odontella Sinensis, Strain Grunow 1884" /NCGR_SAMPLE_ID=MMETSP0160_2 /ASSEMBLY_ACC=CAM_ASM_000250 /LENGTH=294 /DNA_ID=CAMNT_0025468853 /DNA_START=36 /DNA_END=917 /DNA_ORIENTATION=-
MAASAASPKLRFAAKAAVALAVPAVPVLAWWKSAVDDRHRRSEEVRTKVRVPNVQTVDDLVVEKCRPGDVILFDRRCHKCAAGPGAALSCLLGRNVLCAEEDGSGMRRVETGRFDHCGVVVPGKADGDGAKAADPSNLLILEATSGEGIVARPLLTRMEMTQSRSVLLLPLSSAGERRNDDDYEPGTKTLKLRENVDKKLSDFRDKWTEESEKQNYSASHATLGIFGAMGYALNLHETSRAPVSPSAWLCVSALQEAGVAMNVSGRTAMEVKVEDFLRDHRFHEKDTVRLRPGW